MDQFRRESQAITKAGQIKANGKRHEKDDRHGINEDLWSTEVKPFFGQLTRLTADKHRLLCILQGNTWGKGVRLEQERVSFQQVQKTIEILKN